MWWKIEDRFVFLLAQIDLTWFVSEQFLSILLVIIIPASQIIQVPLYLHGLTSWSSGRVQDSGLGSRSSPGFNTLSVRLLVVPLSKALHAALLLSTQEEMGTCEGRFVSRGAKLRVSGCILPRELRWLSRRIWTVKGPMTREGTGQSLQSRALSLDVDSKQWLYLYFTFINYNPSMDKLLHPLYYKVWMKLLIHSQIKWLHCCSLGNG